MISIQSLTLAPSVSRGRQSGDAAYRASDHRAQHLDGRLLEVRGRSKQAGVRAQRVRQPVDDDHYIYVELDFDSIEEAEAFKTFLDTRVWASGVASPALAGEAKARVLTEVSTAS